MLNKLVIFGGSSVEYFVHLPWNTMCQAPMWET